MSLPNSSIYYILECRSPNMMLLFGPPNPSLRDRWLAGHRFQKPVAEPIVVKIKPGHEHGDLLPFFGTATLMSNSFHEALVGAGVDNIDTYDARIQSENGAVVHEGYKAFNLLGIVSAADVAGTKLNPGSTPVIDASVQSLQIDPQKARGLLMFRLAEYVGAIVVHEKVKRVIESRQFRHVQFRLPEDFVS